MIAVQGVANRELTELKRLAGQVAAADLPDVAALDQIALLAADIAGRFREAARRELLEQLTKNTPEIFPDCAKDLPARLTEASLAELSRLEGLLDQAKAAHEALTRADAELMAARERGDYAAMAPLALEADTNKVALAVAGGEFEKQLGSVVAVPAAAEPETVTTPEAVEAAAASPEPAPSGDAVSAADSGDDEADATEADSAEASAEPEPAVVETGSNLVELGVHPVTRGERRRIRDLIRQVRTLPDEAS